MVGVSVAAFLSTNLDNLFLLMALMKDGETPTPDATLGYAGSMTLVRPLACRPASRMQDFTWALAIGSS